MRQLEGRTIVVTGAGRGLGAAFAEACAQAGARIIIGELRVELGEATAQRLRNAGHDVRALLLDIEDAASVDAFAAELSSSGAIDGLLNNAALATGIGGKTFDEIDLDTWDRVMRINVRGTWLMVKAMAPLLRRSTHGGRIVNLASDTALWGAPRLLHYVSSKGAVIAMTRSLSRELGPDGITVNAIAPGLVRVEATDYVPQERKDYYVNAAAIQRPHVPEDTTGAAVFLLSGASAFITGQVLPVNGGLVSA